MTVKGYARYLLVMAGLGGLIYGIDVGVIAAALPYIRNTSDYSSVQLGFIVGAVLWGSVISSLFAGSLSEWLGRKNRSPSGSAARRSSSHLRSASSSRYR